MLLGDVIMITSGNNDLPDPPLVYHIEEIGTYHVVGPKSALPVNAISLISKCLDPSEIGSAAALNRTWGLATSLVSSPSCGNKHDHLLKAQLALFGGTATVPPFFGFTDDQIRGLLSAETCALWHALTEQNSKPRRHYFRNFKRQWNVTSEQLLYP
jgi:hypothetical protein